MFPLEFGIKHLILLIPGFLAFIELQVCISPRALLFFTSLWWVVVALAETKAERTQGCVTKGTAGRLRKVIPSLRLARLRSPPGYRVPLGAQHGEICGSPPAKQKTPPSPREYLLELFRRETKERVPVAGDHS